MRLTIKVLKDRTIYYVNDIVCKIIYSLKKAVEFEKDINFNAFDSVIIL